MLIHRKLNTNGFKFLFSDACRVTRLLADCLNYGCVFVHIHYRQIYFPPNFKFFERRLLHFEVVDTFLISCKYNLQEKVYVEFM